MFHDVSMSSAGILEVKDSELQEVRVSLSGIQDCGLPSQSAFETFCLPSLGSDRMRWTKWTATWKPEAQSRYHIGHIGHVDVLKGFGPTWSQATCHHVLMVQTASKCILTVKEKGEHHETYWLVRNNFVRGDVHSFVWWNKGPMPACSKSRTRTLLVQWFRRTVANCPSIFVQFWSLWRQWQVRRWRTCDRCYKNHTVAASWSEWSRVTELNFWRCTSCWQFAISCWQVALHSFARWWIRTIWKSQLGVEDVRNSVQERQKRDQYTQGLKQQRCGSCCGSNFDIPYVMLCESHENWHVAVYRLRTELLLQLLFLGVGRENG